MHDFFERMYAEGHVPWDRGGPRPLLLDWTQAQRLRGEGERALVVGCGLGWDAELMAGLGFATTAFDVSETGIRMAREAHPGSAVDYRVADLLDLPAEWREAFDLVVECLTIQSLPPQLHERALAAVCECVAPGGRAFVLATAARDDDVEADGPPWPLTRRELDRTPAGIQTRYVEHIAGGGDFPHWRAELFREAILRE
jgi:SAM-dependent methyltransferase